MKYSKWIMCAIFFVSVFGLEHSICPENCICYNDQSVDIVNCSSKHLLELPQKIPENATELYLDGSFLQSLKSDAFAKNQKLKILYFNDSDIERIEKGTFHGLKELEILRLDWNDLSELKGYEFEGLIGLKELYLELNIIRSISNSTFTDLKQLKVLHLEYNRIRHFNVWNLPGSLKEVTLANNPWSCDCEYTKILREWMIKTNAILDFNQMKCLYDEEITLRYYFNNLAAENNSEIGFYIHSNDFVCRNTTKIDSCVNGNLTNKVQND